MEKNIKKLLAHMRLAGLKSSDIFLFEYNPIYSPRLSEGISALSVINPLDRFYDTFHTIRVNNPDGYLRYRIAIRNTHVLLQFNKNVDVVLFDFSSLILAGE